MKPRVIVKSHTPGVPGKSLAITLRGVTATPPDGVPNDGTYYHSRFISKKDCPVTVDCLLTAAKTGVPVPTRLWMASAGIDYDKFVEEFNGKD